MRLSLFLLLACMQVSLASPAQSTPSEYTDIHVTPPDAAVRYTSGNTYCDEALIKGRWVVRFRSGDGRLPMPSEYWNQDGFLVETDYVPATEGWEWIEQKETHTPRGARCAVVSLNNPARGIRVDLHTLLDGTAVLTRWLTVTNTTAKPIALTNVSPWTGKLSRGASYDLGYFTSDQHSAEGWFHWQPLPMWQTVIASVKGQGFDSPFFILRNNQSGEYFTAQLAWSANWRLSFLRDLKGDVSFQFGPRADGPLRIIAPGETVESPAIHLGHLSGDLDQAVQAMHDHVRRSVLPVAPAASKGLIQFVVPGDQGYAVPIDEASVKKSIDVAAAIGAELFILDAYWWDVTCDWHPSKTRFPNGLEPIVAYARQKDMKFGLYVEAEGGRGNVRDSQMAKDHPDWLGPKNIINVGNPEAAAWVESEMRRLIDRYQLDLLRQDYNPDDTGGGLATVQLGMPENNYWRYYEGCYGLYERLAAKYPNLVLQQAAAGGARSDLGMMRRFHESYATDGLYFPREQQVYAGLTMAFPPEALILLHGATGHATIGDPPNFDTVLRTTYSLGIPQVFVAMTAPSLDELTPTRRERYLHYAGIYKDFIRPAFATARMYHHAPVSATGGVDTGSWFAVEFAAPDRGKAWATVMRIGPEDSDTFVLRPRGLDPGRDYRVTVDSQGVSYVASGQTLNRDGIPVRLESTGMSELLLLEAQRQQ